MDVNALIRLRHRDPDGGRLEAHGAIVLWLVGRWLIRLARAPARPDAVREHVDATLARYFQAGVGVTLNIALVVALLGFFGVETTSFAALVAAGGVAIGVAWGGLLSNFAAGVFLVFLRPFKVGDFVSAAGVTGTVEAIGLFGTVINTPDNVLTIVGNNKVFSDNIQNFSANPFRRVDLTVTINNAVDHHRAIDLLKDRLKAIPNVLASRYRSSTSCSSRRRARCCASVRSARTPTTGRWTFDTYRAVREAFGEEGSRCPCPPTRSPACRPRRSKPQGPDHFVIRDNTGSRSNRSLDASPRSLPSLRALCAL